MRSNTALSYSLGKANTNAEKAIVHANYLGVKLTEKQYIENKKDIQNWAELKEKQGKKKRLTGTDRWLLKHYKTQFGKK